MTVALLNSRRREAGLPLIRFDLRKLSAEDIEDLRDAYATLYSVSEAEPGDSRGYWATARGHGYDQDLCHNDSRQFLTWHRAYAYMFERALSAALRLARGREDLWLTLPYWNWTLTDPTTDAANGIPRVLDDPEYTDASGTTRPNPLFRARSLYREIVQGQTGANSMTARTPAAFLAAIPGLADDVARNLDNPDFARFTSDLDGGAHGTVHVRVGGDMGSVVSAAYDPLFWLHHAQVDKVWFDWQSRRPDAPVPAEVLSAAIYGGFRGHEVIDAERQLLYVYSEQVPETAVEVGGTAPDAAEPEPPADTPEPMDGPDPTGGSEAAEPVDAPEPATDPPDASPPTEPADDGSAHTAYVRIGPVAGPFLRAELEFHQLRPPKASYEVRAFFNNEDANAMTPVDDPSYAGKLVLFGHGACYGAPGHCDPSEAVRDAYDRRPKHALRYKSTRYAIDCTRGLRRLLGEDSGPLDVYVALVIVDDAGQAVPHDSITYRGITLSTRS